MFKIITFVILLTVIPFSAYSKGKKESEQPPSWVVHSSEQYPESDYLTAVQSGRTRKEAELNAVESLAAVFERTVTVQTTSELNYTSTEKNGNTDIGTRKNIDKQVKISTDAGKLVGVEIKAVWKDNTGKQYALAVLDKKKAAKIYKQRIELNNNAIETLIQTAKTHGNSLNAYKQYRTAYKKAVQNDQYRRKLSLLQSSAARLLNQQTSDAQALQLKYKTIARNIPIAIQVSGDKNTELTSAFEKVLTNEGFEISKENNARYKLHAELRVTEGSIADKNKTMIRYTFKALLTDTETNTAVVPYSESGRQIHFTIEQAEHKMFTTLKKQIEKNFAAQMAEFLEG